VIYAIVNTKGGVGKTTLAVHLAVMLARQGKTLLIDGDPQLSAASWAAWRREAKHEPSPTTVALVGTAILKEGRDLAPSFTHVVVDAGGRDSTGLRSALVLADQAIIPLGVSTLDTAALGDLLAILEEAKQYNANLREYVLLTRVPARVKDTGEMLHFLDTKQLPILQTKVYERVAYRRAIGEGAIVHEMDKDLLAIAEMEAFLQEVTL
jgi:chromosome partitioning protein